MKKLFAVIGDPIKHSMSPAMHNDLFSFYQIDANYLSFQVKNENLQDAAKGLRAIGAGGFNVTVPHKTAIIPFLDEVDELAASIGAVNTVVNENGKLKGFNTDGLGFLKGLQAYMPSTAGKRILIIGAGGASRAIYFTLAKEEPETIDIANRTVEKAQSLINECPYPVSSSALTLAEAETMLGEYDLVVQTTLIGMEPKISEQPLDLNKIKQQSHVCDIIYNPLKTKFLREAEARGANVQNGIDMFVYQGALAFEKWTGIFPEIKRMRENVLKQLGGTSC
ncbi:shikimate dehydrogenase [Neobacillus mesonae]|uniref:shikimate dehydrogenase n=1 Tax=Neobacillus mesonae TaxID=1193713 RepID=UPI00203C08F8|nr:shikimate dehydrogenase [Neobacillus mesonae]MCM3566540.1 shikimate dehydrogenase [Neobacillus mesonae]